MTSYTKENALVSVIIPCYNHENFIQAAIQSIIDQTHKNIELIIIDDGSKDNSIKKIKYMISVCQERFVRFDFRSRCNKGLCATLNEALNWCNGKFFFALASDDIAMPHKIERQLHELNKINDPDVVGIFSKIIPFSQTPPQFAQPKIRRSSVQMYDFLDVFLRRSKLPAPSALLCLKSVKEIGGYNEKIKIEDFYMWLKLTHNGKKLIYIDEAVTLYRRHEKNTSKKSELMLRGVMDVLEPYSKHPRYTEAVACSLLVHAGDLIENQSLGGCAFLIKAIKKYPSLIFSKLFLTFFYRATHGLIRTYAAAIETDGLSRSSSR